MTSFFIVLLSTLISKHQPDKWSHQVQTLHRKPASIRMKLKGYSLSTRPLCYAFLTFCSLTSSAVIFLFFSAPVTRAFLPLPCRTGILINLSVFIFTLVLSSVQKMFIIDTPLQGWKYWTPSCLIRYIPVTEICILCMFLEVITTLL